MPRATYGESAHDKVPHFCSAATGLHDVYLSSHTAQEPMYNTSNIVGTAKVSERKAPYSIFFIHAMAFSLLVVEVKYKSDGRTLVDGLSNVVCGVGIAW